MFSSALGISVFAALLANFFLSYGTVRRAEFALLTQPNIHEYMARIEEACATWNVAQNVKARVMLTPVSYTHLDVYKRQHQIPTASSRPSHPSR